MKPEMSDKTRNDCAYAFNNGLVRFAYWDNVVKQGSAPR